MTRKQIDEKIATERDSKLKKLIARFVEKQKPGHYQNDDGAVAPNVMAPSQVLPYFLRFRTDTLRRKFDARLCRRLARSGMYLVQEEVHCAYCGECFLELDAEAILQRHKAYGFCPVNNNEMFSYGNYLHAFYLSHIAGPTLPVLDFNEQLVINVGEDPIDQINRFVAQKGFVRDPYCKISDEVKNVVMSISFVRELVERVFEDQEQQEKAWKGLFWFLRSYGHLPLSVEDMSIFLLDFVQSKREPGVFQMYSHPYLNHVNMQTLEGRLATFKNFSSPFVGREELAREGFIYTGSHDHVMCVYCRGVIGSWEPGDIVSQEHKKHFPRCISLHRKKLYCCDLRCFERFGYEVDGIACDKCRAYSFCKCNCVSYMCDVKFCCSRKCFVVKNVCYNNSQDVVCLTCQAINYCKCNCRTWMIKRNERGVYQISLEGFFPQTVNSVTTAAHSLSTMTSSVESLISVLKSKVDSVDKITIGVSLITNLTNMYSHDFTKASIVSGLINLALVTQIPYYSISSALEKVVKMITPGVYQSIGDIWDSLVAFLKGTYDAVAGKFLGALLHIITSIALASRLPSWKEIGDFFGWFGRASIGFRAARDCVVSILDYIKDKYYKLMYGISYTEYRLDMLLPDFKRWMTDQALVRHFTPNFIKTEHSACALIDKVHDRGERFLTYMRANPSYSPTMFATMTRMQNEVRKLWNESLSSPARRKAIRKEPVGIWFYGRPGVGKTELTRMLALDVVNTLHADEKRESYDLNVFSRKPSEEFWSGYNGQLITTFDDACQVVDSVSKPDTTFIEMIRTINSDEYNLPMADLGSKGNTTFSSEHVWATSNVQSPQPKSIADVGALYRRFRWIKVTLFDEYADPSGKLDLSTLPKVNGDREVMCRKIYSLQEYDPATGKEIGNSMSYDRFLDLYVRDFRKHNAAQRRKIAVIESSYQSPDNELLKDIDNMSDDDVLLELATLLDAGNVDTDVQAAVEIADDGLADPNEIVEVKTAKRDLQELKDKNEEYVKRYSIFKVTKPIKEHPFAFILLALLGLFAMYTYKNSRKSKCLLDVRTESELVSALNSNCNCEVCKKFSSIIDDGVSITPELIVACCSKLIVETGIDSELGTAMAKIIATHSMLSGDPNTPNVKKKYVASYQADISSFSKNTAEVAEFILQKNVVLLQSEYQKTGGLLLQGRTMLVNVHAWAMMSQNDSVCIYTPCNLKPFYMFNPKTVKTEIVLRRTLTARSDVIAIQLPKSFPQAPSIVKHFVKRNQFDYCMRNRAVRVGLSLGKKVPIVGVNEIDEVYVIASQLIDKDRFVDLIGYNIPSAKGDCGSVLLTHGRTSGKIFGFHIGGNTEGTVGYSQPLCYEDLIDVIARLGDVLLGANPVIGGDNEIVVDTKAVFQAIGEQETLAYIGRTKPTFNPTKTELSSSIISDVFPKTTAPALLHKTATCDPYTVGLLKFAKKSCDIPQNLIDIAMNDVRRLYGRSSNKRLLTIEEAFHGSEEFFHLNGMERSTSPGYPYILESRKPGKTQWLGSGEEKIIVDQVIDDFRRFENKLNAGIRVNAICVGQLKDERRPLVNGVVKRTRMFIILNFVLNALIRKYFGAFIHHFLKNKISTESSVGVNVYSFDWEVIYRVITQFGEDNLLAADFSDYDGTQSIQVARSMCDLINDWYDDDYGEHRWLLMQDIYCPNVLINGNVMSFFGVNTSGNPLTVIFNTIVGQCYMRCAYLALRPGGPVCDFTENVALQVFGDDSIMGVNPEIHPWFNFTTIQNQFAEFGIKITEETKSETIGEFRKINEVNYLKRGFNTEGTLCRAPLQKEVIQEMILWVRKSWTRGEKIVATLENVKVAVFEASLHGEEYYNWFCEKVERALEREKIYFRAPTIQEQDLEIRSRGMFFAGGLDDKKEVWEFFDSQGKPISVETSSKEQASVGEHFAPYQGFVSQQAVRVPNIKNSISMAADGNCVPRALSFLAYGHQQEWRMIRNRVRNLAVAKRRAGNGGFITEQDVDRFGTDGCHVGMPFLVLAAEALDVSFIFHGMQDNFSTSNYIGVGKFIGEVAIKNNHAYVLLPEEVVSDLKEPDVIVEDDFYEGAPEEYKEEITIEEKSGIDEEFLEASTSFKIHVKKVLQQDYKPTADEVKEKFSFYKYVRKLVSSVSSAVWNAVADDSMLSWKDLTSLFGYIKEGKFDKIKLFLLKIFKTVLCTAEYVLFVRRFTMHKSFVAITFFAFLEEIFKRKTIFPDQSDGMWRMFHRVSQTLLFIVSCVCIYYNPLILVAFWPVNVFGFLVTCFKSEEERKDQNHILQGLLFGIAEFFLYVGLGIKYGICGVRFILIRLVLIFVHAIFGSMPSLTSIIVHANWNWNVFHLSIKNIPAIMNKLFVFTSMYSSKVFSSLCDQTKEFFNSLLTLVKCLWQACDLRACVRSLWRRAIAMLVTIWKRLRGGQPLPKEQTSSSASGWLAGGVVNRAPKTSNKSNSVQDSSPRSTETRPKVNKPNLRDNFAVGLQKKAVPGKKVGTFDDQYRFSISQIVERPRHYDVRLDPKVHVIKPKSNFTPVIVDPNEILKEKYVKTKLAGFKYITCDVVFNFKNNPSGFTAGSYIIAVYPEYANIIENMRVQKMHCPGIFDLEHKIVDINEPEVSISIPFMSHKDAYDITTENPIPHRLIVAYISEPVSTATATNFTFSFVLTGQLQNAAPFIPVDNYASAFADAVPEIQAEEEEEFVSGDEGSEDEIDSVIISPPEIEEEIEEEEEEEGEYQSVNTTRNPKQVRGGDIKQDNTGLSKVVNVDPLPAVDVNPCNKEWLIHKHFLDTKTGTVNDTLELKASILQTDETSTETIPLCIPQIIYLSAQKYHANLSMKFVFRAVKSMHGFVVVLFSPNKLDPTKVDKNIISKYRNQILEINAANDLEEVNNEIEIDIPWTIATPFKQTYEKIQKYNSEGIEYNIPIVPDDSNLGYVYMLPFSDFQDPLDVTMIPYEVYMKIRDFHAIDFTASLSPVEPAEPVGVKSFDFQLAHIGDTTDSGWEMVVKDEKPTIYWYFQGIVEHGGKVELFAINVSQGVLAQRRDSLITYIPVLTALNTTYKIKVTGKVTGKVVCQYGGQPFTSIKMPSGVSFTMNPVIGKKFKLEEISGPEVSANIDVNVALHSAVTVKGSWNVNENFSINNNNKGVFIFKNNTVECGNSQFGSLYGILPSGVKAVLMKISESYLKEEYKVCKACNIKPRYMLPCGHDDYCSLCSCFLGCFVCGDERLTINWGSEDDEYAHDYRILSENPGKAGEYQSSGGRGRGRGGGRGRGRSGSRNRSFGMSGKDEDLMMAAHSLYKIKNFDNAGVDDHVIAPGTSMLIREGSSQSHGYQVLPTPYELWRSLGTYYQGKVKVRVWLGRGSSGYNAAAEFTRTALSKAGSVGTIVIDGIPVNSVRRGIERVDGINGPYYQEAMEYIAESRRQINYSYTSVETRQVVTRASIARGTVFAGAGDDFKVSVPTIPPRMRLTSDYLGAEGVYQSLGPTTLIPMITMFLCVSGASQETFLSSWQYDNFVKDFGQLTLEIGDNDIIVDTDLTQIENYLSDMNLRIGKIDNNVDSIDKDTDSISKLTKAMEASLAAVDATTTAMNAQIVLIWGQLKNVLLRMSTTNDLLTNILEATITAKETFGLRVRESLIGHVMNSESTLEVGGQCDIIPEECTLSGEVEAVIESIIGLNYICEILHSC
ncbi:MAG: polyprotein [Macrobrachium rosenbergii virus 7]|nr:MAG: polyprotein [Macrobrachium rosenbergii virus 7]